MPWTIMDYSNFYDLLLLLHAVPPYYFGGGRAWPPARVQLELTYRCNLRCFMCYQDKQFLNQKELSAREWISLINQLPKFFLLTLIGGEPLIRDDFLEIAEKALSHPTNLVTNGTLVGGIITQFLIDKKLLLLGVSLDGIGKVHDEIRGVRGTYQKVIENLKQLQERKEKSKRKFPLLDIKTVVTDKNLDNLTELADIVGRIKADYLTLSLPKVSGGQFSPKLKGGLSQLTTFDASLLEQIDFAKLSKKIKEIKNLKSISGTKIRIYPQFRSLSKITKEAYRAKNLLRLFAACRQPWSAIQISASGEVYPCLSVSVGNIRKKPFRQIWNGKEMVEFRRTIKKNALVPACLGCCYLREKHRY